MELSQIFSAQIEKQRMEIDRFVSFQSQRLKQALKEQRKQQNALLIKKMERKTLLLLKRREEEIEKAAKRTMELQELLNRAEVENQTWRKAAEEKEATITSLKSTIERLKENTNLSSTAAGDAESCCRRSSEEGGMDWHWKKILCRCCNSRNSRVIMLPCRHLCSCKNCETFLDFCPVCGAVKKGSLEALI